MIRDYRDDQVDENYNFCYVTHRKSKTIYHFERRTRVYNINVTNCDGHRSAGNVHFTVYNDLLSVVNAYRYPWTMHVCTLITVHYSVLLLVSFPGCFEIFTRLFMCAYRYRNFVEPLSLPANRRTSLRFNPSRAVSRVKIYKRSRSWCNRNADDVKSEINSVFAIVP